MDIVTLIKCKFGHIKVLDTAEIDMNDTEKILATYHDMQKLNRCPENWQTKIEIQVSAGGKVILGGPAISAERRSVYRKTYGSYSFITDEELIALLPQIRAKSLRRVQHYQELREKYGPISKDAEVLAAIQEAQGI